MKNKAPVIAMIPRSPPFIPCALVVLNLQLQVGALTWFPPCQSRAIAFPRV